MGTERVDVTFRREMVAPCPVLRKKAAGLFVKKYILWFSLLSVFVDQLAYSNTVEENLYREISLEDLLKIEVEVVTKSSEKSHLSPAITTVITSEDIERFGFQNLADVLTHVSGFADNYDMAMHNFGVRGINSGARSGNRTIKFMINGQSVTFHATSQHFIDDELLPINSIKQVEIVRGPVSALYGANAFLGVINVVTKTSSELSNSLNIKSNVSKVNEGLLFGGNYSERLGSGELGIAFNIGHNDRAGIALPRRSPNYELFDATESIEDTSKPKSLYINWHTKQKNAGAKIKLTAFYQQLNLDNVFNDINPLPAFDVSRIALENMVLRADYEHELSDDLLVRGHIAYNRGGTLDDDKVEVGAEQFYLERRFGFDGVELGAELTWKFGAQGELLFGWDGKQHDHKIETFSRIDRISGMASEINPPQNKTLDNIGVFAQYSVDISRAWRMIAGIRSDDDSVIGQHTSSRLGFVGQVFEDTVVKLLYGSSFQAPSPELLYRTAVQAGDIIGNPNLDAQTADTYEISFSRPFGSYVYASLTYFYTEVDKLVVFNSDGSNLFAQNSASHETEGVETELRLIWKDVNAFFNFSWQESRRGSSEFSLYKLERRPTGELFPKGMANIGLSYYWQKPEINLSFTTRWVDKRPASSSNVLLANQVYHLDPYWLSNFTVSSERWSLVEGYTTHLRMHIRDLFDHNPVTPGFGGVEFPGAGRQLMFSIEQEF